MRLQEKDIIFDDDIDGGDDTIDGYLWATDKLCEIAGYKGSLDSEDYINLYPTYDIKEDKWYVVASGAENDKSFNKHLDLTQDEMDLISRMMIEYYFGTKENWNDFVQTTKEERDIQ